MKRLSLLLLVVLLASCSKEYQGIHYKFERSSAGLGKSTRVQRFQSVSLPLEGDIPNYTRPDEALVACSRIIFPVIGDAQAIFDSLALVDIGDKQEIPVSEPDYRDYLTRAIVAYNATSEDPLVVSIDESQLMYLDTLDIADEDRFRGMILETVYIEFAFEDFRMRWYYNDHSSYRFGDVLLKRDSESSWKHVYNQCHIDTTDTRQNDIFYWVHGDAGISPSPEALTHAVYYFTRDLEGDRKTTAKTVFYTCGKSSTAETRGGFGRLDNQIIGFSISLIYNLESTGESGNFGLMHNLGTTQENMISYSDLEQATTMPKQL